MEYFEYFETCREQPSDVLNNLESDIHVLRANILYM